MPKYRKMLSDWYAPYIQALVKLIETQSKQTLINWATGYCERFLLPIWNSFYPQDNRPANAITAARRWQNKEIKLPQAKVEILKCHEAARAAESNPAAQAAARAIAQCASTIHSARHCIALPLYGALAVAEYELGIDASWNDLEQRAALECGKMLEFLQNIAVPDEPNPAKINWNC